MQQKVPLSKKFHRGWKTADWWVDDVAEIIGISYERAHHTLTQELGVKKRCARWLPHLELLHFLGVQCGRESSSMLVRPRLNSSAYLQTVGFEVAASPDTFFFSFWFSVGTKQFLTKNHTAPRCLILSIFKTRVTRKTSNSCKKWINWQIYLKINSCSHAVSYTHLDVYKRQGLHL